MELKKELQELRKAVESTMCRELKTYGDFAALEKSIMERQHEHISSTTLRRFWGYQNDQPGEVREASLDILARYAGYVDWQAFQESGGGNIESGRTEAKRIQARELFAGDRLRLLWKPDREVTIELKGQDLFEVVESKNSKLQAGDKFLCPLFVEDMPLVLTCLMHKDNPPVDYVCGRNTGIKFVKVS